MSTTLRASPSYCHDDGITRVADEIRVISL
jgi:hypothetical protein